MDPIQKGDTLWVASLWGGDAIPLHRYTVTKVGPTLIECTGDGITRWKRAAVEADQTALARTPVEAVDRFLETKAANLRQLQADLRTCEKRIGLARFLREKLLKGE